MSSPEKITILIPTLNRADFLCRLLHYFADAEYGTGFLLGIQPFKSNLDCLAHGWQAPTTHIRQYQQLPTKARHYLARLAELAGCPINLVCIGPEREQTIEVKPIL